VAELRGWIGVGQSYRFDGCPALCHMVGEGRAQKCLAVAEVVVEGAAIDAVT
jgi:hypothetical protein